ncbi:MAG: MaoC/PaaZ C-terminal domain-containing protein, partial [Alphaproteobacteria bacterium]
MHSDVIIQNLLDADEMVSDWMTIEQADTDLFAKLTDDEDPMHNDPQWAATTHWGGTIVQAAHVLSLGVGQVTSLPVQT